MIVTLTPNPSVDRAVEVDALVRGAVLRATANRVDPGGKGVNVSRALAANAVPTVALFPAGGPEGAHLIALLDAAHIAHSVVPIAAPTRANITVVEPDGTTTKLNEAGPTLTPGDVDALVMLVAATLRGQDGGSSGAWLAVCGSLPPGAPDDLYDRLARTVHAHGARLAVDASGEGLRQAVAAGPDLVKPNLEELEEFAGRTLPVLADVVEAAHEMRAAGAGAVLASLGAHGAVLVDGNGAVHGSAPVHHPRSTVGAGDAMLAGYLAAATHASGPPDPTAALKRALAYGAAATALPGSVMPGPDDLDLSGVAITPRPDLELRWEAAP